MRRVVSRPGPIALLLTFTLSAASHGQTTSQPASGPATAKPGEDVLVETSGPFQIRSFQLSDDEARRWALFVPPQYAQQPEKKWPVIVFLHGSGECGNDGIAQTRVGLPAHIAEWPERFPFITIMPQAHRMWFRGKEAAVVWILLEHVLRDYRADPERIYLTGLSMGGFATWEFATARPDVFAAVAPVCGVGNAAFASNLRGLPLWAFHGRNDDRVPVEGSREPIEALKLMGESPRYTEYPDGNHAIWDSVYRGKALYRWLLEHRRRPPPRKIEHVMPGPVAQVWWLGARAEQEAGKPPVISAEVKENGEVRIDSTGVAAWSLTAMPGVLERGAEVRVFWNGRPVFEGVFPGQIVCPAPAGMQAATQPTATRPAGGPDDKADANNAGAPDGDAEENVKRGTGGD